MSKSLNKIFLKAGTLLAFFIFTGFGCVYGQFLLVKTHLAQLPFGQVGLGVEKVFNRQFSVQLNAQYLIPNNGVNYINKHFLTEDELENSKLRGYAFSLESRAYTYEARNEAWKWYLGIFFRYGNYAIESELQKETTAGVLNGELVNSSGGLELGINYIYKNKYSFDFTFLGLGFARNSLIVEYNSKEEMPPIGVLENGIREIPIIGSRVQLKREGEKRLLSENDYATLAVRFAFTVGVIL